jgi:hypothetical protein
MPRYEYSVVLCAFEALSHSLNEAARDGFKLFHIQPLNNYVGHTIGGQPKIEISYQLIFEKMIVDKMNN